MHTNEQTFTEEAMWDALGLDTVDAEMQSHDSLPDNHMMGTTYTGCRQCDNTAYITRCQAGCFREI